MQEMICQFLTADILKQSLSQKKSSRENLFRNRFPRRICFIINSSPHAIFKKILIGKKKI